MCVSSCRSLGSLLAPLIVLFSVGISLFALPGGRNLPRKSSDLAAVVFAVDQPLRTVLLSDFVDSDSACASICGPRLAVCSPFSERRAAFR